MSATVRHRCSECFAPVNPRVLAATREVLTLGCSQTDAAARYDVPQGSVANKIAQARAAAADREKPEALHLGWENGEPISPGELVDAAKAEERARIVKELREAAHGGNRGQPGSFWVGWRAAARAIEEGWAEKPETDT